MRLPNRYLKLKLAQVPFRLSVDETGKPLVWNRTYDFVPHGFLATDLYALGNGDSCGFYWPIGKEEEEPLLGEIYHDQSLIVPVASTLEGLAKIKALMGFQDDEGADYKIMDTLGVDLPQKQNGAVPAPSCLEEDQASPFYLVEVSKSALKENDTALAEQYLQRAIQVLPEYSTAYFYQASLYRRERSQQLRAAEAMIAAITSPLVFLTNGSRKQVLHWLQSLPDMDYPDLATDPIWSSRQKLSFEQGVKQNDDFAIYEEAIVDYLDRGQGVKAIRLRVLVGELMLIETRTFRERYAYSDERHNELLVDNLKRAGLEVRVEAICPPRN